MIKLAFQVPFAYLYHNFGDFDFALADFVLNHEGYREYYKKSLRECILDNSIHELGASLALDKLEEAFYTIEPRWVIPPDVMFNSKKTLHNVQVAESVFLPSQILPVLQASTIGDFIYIQDALIDKGYKYLAVPYRMDRLSILPYLRSDISYHFLGLMYPEEFENLKMFPMVKSLDTGKPFRKGKAKLDMNSKDLDRDEIQKTIDSYRQKYEAPNSSSSHFVSFPMNLIRKA